MNWLNYKTVLPLYSALILFGLVIWVVDNIIFLANCLTTQRCAIKKNQVLTHRLVTYSNKVTSPKLKVTSPDIGAENCKN